MNKSEAIPARSFFRTEPAPVTQGQYELLKGASHRFQERESVIEGDGFMDSREVVRIFSEGSNTAQGIKTAFVVMLKLKRLHCGIF